MRERVQHMLIKEFIQVFRDPRMRAVIFVIPVVQLLVFGYAVNTDVKHVATAVFDLDHSVASRELVSRFSASRYFDIAEYVSSDEQTRSLLDHGKVTAVLRMNKGFEADLLAGRGAHLQLLVDGTDSNTARIVLNYSVVIASRFSQGILAEQSARLRGAAVQPVKVDLETRAWFNENLESRNFYVPGVIASLVMLITLLLTSMAIVREREVGTMEQIMVSPITPVEFILGKTVPFALISIADVILVTVVGVYWFRVPIRGNLFLLFLGAVVYLMCALGIGLLISTVSQTQQQAMMSTFFFFMPAILLSGFMFPIRNMPKVIQWLTYLNPLRYFLIIIRGIFLKGIGMGTLWPQFVALAIMSISTLTLASRRFRKTLT